MASNDAFVMLNDMLAEWSNQRMMISYVTEVIFTLTGGTYQYSIGPAGTIFSTFQGSQAANVLTVTSLTTGGIALGQTVGAGTITSFGTGAGGQAATALGTYTMSNNATIGAGAQTAYYQRPLRVNSGFTRVATIDYPMQVLNVEQYKLIGLKALNGPWPRAVYYQPSEILGNVVFWPNPSSGEVHLFCDTVLGQFNTQNDTIQLPQGSNMGLRWSLAELLMPEYGKASEQQIAMIMKNAARFRGSLKRTNMQPPQTANFDPALMQGKPNDAGWILAGGLA